MKYEVRATRGGRDDSVTDQVFDDRLRAQNRAYRMNQDGTSDLAYFTLPVTEEEVTEREQAVAEAMEQMDNGCQAGT